LTAYPIIAASDGRFSPKGPTRRDAHEAARHFSKGGDKMDETRRLAMRRAHARRAYYCTCGKVVHGNGGENSHRQMHVRRGDWKRDFTGSVVNEHGHTYVVREEYERRGLNKPVVCQV
jgi:Ni/Co efflux regulator RcnB